MLSVQNMQYVLEILWLKRLIQQRGTRGTVKPFYEYEKFGGVTNVFKSGVDVIRFQGFDRRMEEYHLYMARQEF